MGDILPPKRQTVVDRLRRRLELYRRHQGSCLPRYDQTANGLYDAQRHDTLILKQRYLESKAKKTRRNDHRHTRDNNLASSGDTQRNALVTQSKLKRAAGSPLLDCAVDGLGDPLTQSHQTKIPRTGPNTDHPNNNSTQHQQQQQHHQQQQQQQQQQAGIPSFSVQIVQQFTSSSTSQAPHSQTIQTNVTVQALSGTIKNSNSPLTSSTISTTSSPGRPAGDTGIVGSTGGAGTNPGSGGTSTSISVGTNIECKQERDTNFSQCSVSSTHHPIQELSSAPDLDNPNNATTTSSSTAATAGDRFSDSLANLGFPEDSNDDVIHPDILNDLIDDVFTNPSDLMNGFSFVDNVKDNAASNGSNAVDDKDSLRTMMNMGKTMPNSSPNPQTHFQPSNPVVSQFSVTQSQQSVFDFQTGNMGTSASPHSVSNTAVAPGQGFPQNRIQSYSTAPSNLSAMSNNGLGLDFKLTEPSPAAQTLKQMAEQHQSMQQKQQQMGLSMAPSHPRSPFGSDSFPDPLSNIRSNFLNGSQTTINSLQKSPNNIYQPMGFGQQPTFAGSTPTNPGTVKQEVGASVPPMYSAMNTSSMGQHLSEMELHKRRQQVLQLQQQQMANSARPGFARSPDQKPPLGINPAAYGGTRPLSHFSEPSPGTPGSASQSPIPHHPNQFMRGVPTPGVTPPPNFGSSPTPTGTTLHLSQSQQLQISQNSQQLQVSQSQQQLLVSQDLKPSISPQQQQQQHAQTRNFYPGHTSVHMAQSQSVSFQFGGPSGAGPPPSGTPTATARQRATAQSTAAAQRQMQQYMGRPPPEYQASMDPSSNANNLSSSANLVQQSQQQMMNPSDSGVMLAGQRLTGADHRKGVSRTYPDSPTSQHAPYPGTVPIVRTEQNLVAPPVGQMNIPASSMSSAYTSGQVNAQVAAARHNMPANKPLYTSAHARHQRPPNVNVGPEGLNISQRPPGMTSDWRQVFMQQQQQANISHIRMPYPRNLPTNYGPNSGSGGGLVAIGMDGNVANNTGGGGNLMPRDIMSNQLRPLSDTAAMQPRLHNSQSTNNHLLMQQQQHMIQGGSATNPTGSALGTSQMQMSSRGSPMTTSQPPQQVYVPPPSSQTSSPPDDTAPNSIQDSTNQFSLDFLDGIDCSTSDLLNFDHVMQGTGGSTGFPLLDDMGMLGK